MVLSERELLRLTESRTSAANGVSRDHSGSAAAGWAKSRWMISAPAPAGSAGLSAWRAVSPHAAAGLAKSTSHSTRSATRVPPRASMRTSISRPMLQKLA